MVVSNKFEAECVEYILLKFCRNKMLEVYRSSIIIFSSTTELYRTNRECQAIKLLTNSHSKAFILQTSDNLLAIYETLLMYFQELLKGRTLTTKNN
jgi:hypothetical protein